jgi:hypothetical protein
MELLFGNMQDCERSVLIWKIRTVFLRTGNVNISPVIKPVGILTACFVFVPCMQRRTARGIPYIGREMERGSKTVLTVCSRTGRRIMER